METWEIVGIDTKVTLKFDDGRNVAGARWHMVGDAPEADADRFMGRYVKTQFISNERLKALGVLPKVGQIVTLYFNRYGDICKVDVV